MTWKTRKLHEVANVFSGYAFKSSDMDKQEGIPLIKIKNIYDKKVDKNCETYLNQLAFKKNYQRFFLQKDDFLVAMTGQGSVGRIGKMRSYVEGFLVNQRVGIVRVNKDIADPEFVYQSLATDDTEGMYFNLAMGAGQPNLSPKDIGSANVPFPPLAIQKKIGSLLAAYDDLIENNLKRIKLLEEMAQITYEEWFVRLRFPGHESTTINSETGLPEGWEKLSLSQIGEYLNGYAFKPKDLGNEGMPIIKIKEIKGGVVNDTPRNIGETIPEKYWVETGEILFSWSASLEVVIWQYERGLLNQHLFKVTPQKGVSKAFLFLALKEALKVFDGLTTGATMKHIKRKELDFVQTAVPDNRIMQKFDALVGAVIEEILNLSKQNQRLRESRDILLPRLMTGVIDVESYDPAQLTKEVA